MEEDRKEGWKKGGREKRKKRKRQTEYGCVRKGGRKEGKKRKEGERLRKKVERREE